MNKTKTSITIGIPTFNEEKNIGNLLSDLNKQVQNNIEIVDIIVSDDASRDETVNIAKTMPNSVVRVILNIEREGVAARQNQLLDYSNTEIAVLLDADIRIEDLEFIEKLVSPIRKGKADLCSANMIETYPKTLIEKALYVSTKIKEEVFSEYKNANNVFTCHGPARAFSRALYSKIRFTSSVGEDAYSYLYAKFNGYKYSYRPNAKIIYKLPSKMSDHINQSRRFIKSKELMKKYYGNEAIEIEYKLPMEMFYKKIIKYLMINPFYILIYLGIYMYINIITKFNNDINEARWIKAESTKIVR